MSKECVEYKLHRNEKGNLTTPSWMSDGGYFQSPIDKSLVGFVPAESERQWFVPDSVKTLTQAEFVARGNALHTANKFKKVGDNAADLKDMTNAEATQMLTSFYQSKTA